MRANKTYMIEVDILKEMQTISEEEKKSINDVANILFRHGLIRYRQELKQRATLAPTDDEKLR